MVKLSVSKKIICFICRWYELTPWSFILHLWNEEISPPTLSDTFFLPLKTVVFIISVLSRFILFSFYSMLLIYYKYLVLILYLIGFNGP